MILKKLGPNMAEVTTGVKVILFSYETPVAACLLGKFYKTSKKWSCTTTTHMEKWLAVRFAQKVQERERESKNFLIICRRGN